MGKKLDEVTTPPNDEDGEVNLEDALLQQMKFEALIQGTEAEEE